MTACPDEERRDPLEPKNDPSETARRETQTSPGERRDTAPPVSGAVESSSWLLQTDRYSRLEIIDSGGSSLVFRAKDTDILRDVAIKILKPELAGNTYMADRFAQEARINGQLEHPSIAPVYELGTDRGGRRFLCTKLIEGKNLEAKLAGLGEERLDPAQLAELLQVFVKVCDAISFAHSRGVIHRDLKPKNIMASDFGQVYVIDWGIAQVLRRSQDHEGARVRASLESEHSELDPSGLPMGTPGYAPPEQWAGMHDRANESTDVFALGAILYQILAGAPPGDSGAEMPPERSVSRGRVPQELSRIAMRALSHDPSKRYQTVPDLKRDIESFQRGAWDLPRVAWPAGSVIMTEGDPGDAAYVILEGTCNVYQAENGDDVVLRVMGPGEVFGEAAVVLQESRSASVKALTDVVLVKVSADVLSSGLGLNSWMGAFVRTLANRFRHADRKLRDFERTSRRSAPPSSVRAGYSYPPLDAAAASLAEPLGHAASFQPRTRFPAGAIIVNEGDPGDAGYVVLDGSCLEYRTRDGTETPLREIGIGDVFGEVAILGEKPHVASVRAATEVELLVVGREVMLNAPGVNPSVRALVRALAKRLAELEERLRGATVT